MGYDYLNESIDLLTSIDSEDVAFAIDAEAEAAEWVGNDDARRTAVIAEAFRIVTRERWAGGDSPINDAAWEAIARICRLAAVEAVQNLKKEVDIVSEFKVADIIWETDGEVIELPRELTVILRGEYPIVDGLVPDDALDRIFDQVSDEHGWLVKGALVTPVVRA